MESFKCAHTEIVDLHKLQPNPKNPNKHPDRQIELLSKIIDYQGQRAPIVVSKRSGFITKGHGRLMALQKLGWSKAAIDTQDYANEAEEYADVVADNKIAELAKHDDMMMIDTLRDMDFDLDLDLLGMDDFSLPEIKELDNANEDTVPTDVEKRCKQGDLWILGEHRLLCGDSTNIQHVERLMAGDNADMVFTDPPYNIGFKGALSSTSKDGKLVKMADGYSNPNSNYDDIENDNKSKEEFNSFVSDILTLIQQYCMGGWYICFSSKTIDQILNPLISVGMGWKSIIIWNKNQSPMGGGHFRKKYEPIVYGYFKNNFYGKEYAEDDVWDVDRTNKNDLHPTMKPVSLIEKAIGYSSVSKGSILDLFGGSGSTLIACEKTNRKCYMMELDPHYCSVILKRWEDYTGQKARLESQKEITEDKV